MYAISESEFAVTQPIRFTHLGLGIIQPFSLRWFGEAYSRHRERPERTTTLDQILRLRLRISLSEVFGGGVKYRSISREVPREKSIFRRPKETRVTFGDFVIRCSATEVDGMTDSQHGRYGLAFIDSLLRLLASVAHDLVSLQQW